MMRKIYLQATAVAVDACGQTEQRWLCFNILLSVSFFWTSSQFSLTPFQIDVYMYRVSYRIEF